MFKFMIALAVLLGIPSPAFSQIAEEASAEVTLTFKNPFISPLPKKDIAEEDRPVAIPNSIQKVQEPEITLPNLVINGLVWNTPTPQAIINAQVVAAGDSIDGIKVLKIDPRSIEVEFKGKHFVIPADKQVPAAETTHTNNAINQWNVTN